MTVTVAAADSKAITVFNFNALTPAVIGTVDEAAKTVALTVPFGTDVTILTPTITHNGSSVAPLSGVANDFTVPATYTVTAADASTQDYVVTVTVAAADSKAITVFDFNGLVPAVIGTVDEVAKTVALTVPFGTVVAALVPTITHDGSSVAPLSGAVQDFTAPATYTVTAADSSTQDYVVTVAEVTCPDGTCDIAGGECTTCAADCACVNLGDSGCDLTFKSVCCDNAITENLAGEICDVADGNIANMDLNGKTCNFFGYTGGTLGCRWDCFNYDPSSCAGVIGTCGNNICDAGENCLNCPTECCPLGCPDFCFSEGYECGTQDLCGVPTDCGSCVFPATCNVSGICVLPSLVVSINSPLNGTNYTEGDLVDFEGFVLGGTPDYTYEWSSDNEALVLSTERVFSSRDLSANTHTITLKVTDNNAVVSQDSVNITVHPAGTLSVTMVLGQTEFYRSFGYFIAGVVASGGTGAYSYQWSSNLAGNFSTDKLPIIDFSTIPAWALGAHTITLSVTDGVATAQDTKIINVVEATSIYDIYPKNGDHFIVGQSVLFLANQIIGWSVASISWTSDVYGLIGSAQFFQKNDLTEGLHTITVKIKDSNFPFTAEVIKTFQIQIDPVPTVCVPDWDCIEWSFCALGNRTRVCTDNNFCGDDTTKPAEIDNTCIDVSATAVFDWRNNAGNWMTPIRDQGGCGSCWAFATLGSVEAKYNIQNSNLNLDENLSEQDLVSCSYAGDCNGGDPNLAMYYLQTVGINKESCFPYQSANAVCSGKCALWQNNIWNIDSSSSNIGMIPQIMKDKIINDGPIVVVMNADPASNGWDAGTLGCLNDTSLNHAVVIVGYDDLANYWIVRNSWGTDWPNLGDDGYFEVIYGECGIESKMYYPGKVLSP